MDSCEYRRRGKEMVDYIADYLDNIRDRRVFPDVSPGYMRKLVPDSAPEDGECWQDIFTDVERVIMPGITHWQSPHMHAYFPGLNSYPSLLGDMLANAIGCLGFTWASSPACTELESIVMDWLGKLIGLPAAFMHSNKQTKGGGVIQTTASEATFVALLAARTEIIKRLMACDPDVDAADINNRLVAYCSEQAHSSVEKASLIGMVKLRLLETDEKLSLRGEVLRDAINEDLENGLIPFYLCATIGTTGACAFDNLLELGPICEEHEIWMHIDAAYAGTALICPEYRHFIEGIEHAQSFAFNPSKWMMVHFDCTAMWVKNSGALHQTFNVEPLYLKHENTGAAIDYMGVNLAKHFEMLVRGDELFEIPAARFLGMVVFRLKGENELTESLLTTLNRSGKVHMVPASLKSNYVIRFTVTSSNTTVDDIERDWAIIRDAAVVVLGGRATQEQQLDMVVQEARTAMSPVGVARKTGLKHKEFGMSLVLSNVPLSPKFINGSFAAMFSNNVIIRRYARHLERTSIDLNGRPIRLSPRHRLRCSERQNSFDLGAVPSRRGPAENFKQGSLDSKIEELFYCTGMTRNRRRTLTNGKVSEENNGENVDGDGDTGSGEDEKEGALENGTGEEEEDDEYNELQQEDNGDTASNGLNDNAIQSTRIAIGGATENGSQSRTNQNS